MLARDLALVGMDGPGDGKTPPEQLEEEEAQAPRAAT